ncbi:MAG: hypothetical protein V7K67_28210 [Nostoc sp.]
MKTSAMCDFSQVKCGTGITINNSAILQYKFVVENVAIAHPSEKET